jgi:two-component system alkaline phosphatase synthesis response regulator PhoP
MDGFKVLLVDDEQDIVDTIKYSLELRGFDVDVAYDGISAIHKARQNKYDLMILDVMLPGKNGYQVCRILKDEMEEMELDPFRIMLITARKLDSSLREDFVSTWSKADHCLYKPFELEKLIDTIKSLMEPVRS